MHPDPGQERESCGNYSQSQILSQFFFFCLFRAAPVHMEGPRLGVESEL